MDIVALTRRAVDLTSRDERLREQIRDTVVSIVMSCKDGDGELAFTFRIDKGRISVSQEKLDDPDFQFEMSRQDYFNLMTGRAYGMALMATQRMRMTKGAWTDITKIAAPLSVIPKMGKEIAAEEKIEEV